MQVVSGPVYVIASQVVVDSEVDFLAASTSGS